ncbi:hypothetical protein [Aquisphaera insulae]|uniref:hypothetical protein n=1 Tax=Aquisphaera insulae TaxID=2712864 RepID=UPI0013EC025D|nr:hypothetical protein [Aquisphaera insulae]
MPKLLKDRWRPECIREFRAAANERYQDGLALAIQGRRTGAIYLWGYSAEMALKAAYFTLFHSETATLDWKSHILPAIQHAKLVRQIAWPVAGQGHNVRAWAELLVAERASISGRAYEPRTARQVQVCGQRIGQLWSESLRYHGNLAYSHEVTRVRLAAEWLLINLVNL